MAPRNQKIDGLLRSPTRDLLALEFEVSTELAQLGNEVTIPAANDAHIAHPRGSLGGQCSNEVAKSAAQVGNLDVCTVQFGGT